MAKIHFKSEREYKGYLRVNSAGKQWLFDQNHITERENGRIDYSVIYILRGKGLFETDDEKFEVSEGSMIFYAPNVKQKYGFKKDDNSIILWSHFSGTACDVLNECFAESPTVLLIGDRKQFESAFSKMIAAFYKKSEYSEMLCSSYMSVLISLIAQSRTDSPKGNFNFSNEKIEDVLSLMLINYNRPIDIKKYAKICNVSEDHFIRIFKAYTGLPPYKYQLNLRINHAIEMLENTSVTVSQCAEEVGFGDAAYFSRIFKKFTGKSPSYYKSGKNK